MKQDVNQVSEYEFKFLQHNGTPLCPSEGSYQIGAEPVSGG